METECANISSLTEQSPGKFLEVTEQSYNKEFTEHYSPELTEQVSKEVTEKSPKKITEQTSKNFESIIIIQDESEKEVEAGNDSPNSIQRLFATASTDSPNGKLLMNLILEISKSDMNFTF